MSDTNPAVTMDSIRERIDGSLPAALGVEPLEITDQLARGRLIVDQRHLHPGGLVHGATWVALADSVGAWQTLRHLPAGWDFTTLEMKLNVFAAGRPGDELVATAEHLHAGRSTHVVEVRVRRIERSALQGEGDTWQGPPAPHPPSADYRSPSAHSRRSRRIDPGPSAKAHDCGRLLANLVLTQFVLRPG